MARIARANIVDILFFINPVSYFSFRSGGFDGCGLTIFLGGATFRGRGG
jgi:hypothetical protein